MVKNYSTFCTPVTLLVLLVLGSSWLLVVPAYSQDEVIPLTTTSAEARAALVAGRDLAENQNFDKAQVYFTKALAKDSTCAIAYLYLAQVSPQPGSAYVNNLKRAIGLMEKASDGERQLIKAELAQAEGQVAKATALLQKLAKQYPADNRVCLALATHYLRQLDFTAAEATLKTGIILAPDFPPYSLWLGQIAATVGQFPVAAKAIQKYQQLLPHEPNGYLAAGNVLSKQELYSEAIKSFEAALQLDPEFYPAYLGLSTSYLLNNKATEARSQSEKLFQLAPNSYWRRQALFSLSATYVDEGKYDKALVEARKSLELAQKMEDKWVLASEHNYLGNIYLAQNKTAEAQNQFQRAKLLGEQTEGFTGMKNQVQRYFLAREAEVALVNKNLVTARQKILAYQKMAVAQQDPTAELDAHRLLGVAALQEKRYDVALQEFKKANPHDPRTWYLSGTAHLAKGDKAQARMHWVTAAQFNQMQYEYLLIRRKVKI